MEASSSSSSLVSKAKTALHSAAAKAERVIADFGRNTESETKAEVPETTGINITRDSQNHFVESPKKDPAEEDAYVKAFGMVSIPPILVVRQLASATEMGHSFKSMKDLAAPSKDYLQGNDWSGFVPSFSSIKILSLQDKDERLRSQHAADGANHSLLWSLFETDRQYSEKKCNDASLLSSKTHFLSDNHGAPPGSFLVQLVEIIAGIKSVQKMALFWLQVVGEEGPILTEDLIRETEELILRTGSVGAGCSQLFSDMQAFKAANPGCILEDFVRWYSPPDWKEETCNLSDEASDNDKGSSRRGHLSKRMQAKGNLWRELWESAKPIPAAKQTPLFDEDLAGESTISYLEDIAPSDLFEQLFIVALSSGFAIAEAAPAAKKDNVSKWFKECKEYVISTCCRGMDIDTLEHLCEVYETMEAIVIHPNEDIFNEVCESNVEGLVAEIPKGRLQKFGIHNVHLPNIEKHMFRRNLHEQKGQIDKDDNHHNFFSRLIEGKNSLFGKKSQKPTSTAQNKKLGVSESEWTIL